MYREALLVESGIPPYSWSIESGALPTGLLLDSITGIILGTPDSAGIFNFSVLLTDAEHHTAKASFSIAVTRIIVGENITIPASIQKETVAGATVKDTIILKNDSLDLSYTFYAARADDKAEKLTPATITLQNGGKALVVTHPKTALNDTCGEVAFLVVDNDSIFDTVSIAHPVKREKNNVDNLTIDSMVWTPLSVTATPVKNDIASVLSLFKKSGTDWSFDKSKFRIIQWFPSPATVDNKEQWVEGSDANRSLFSFQPGQLFWIRTAKNVSIDYGSAIVAPVDATNPFSVNLNEKQWTDFALPYTFSVPLGTVIEATRSNLISNKQRIENLELYSWEKESGAYKAVLVYGNGDTLIDTLKGGPGTGYTIYNPGASFPLLIPAGSRSSPIAKMKVSAVGKHGFRVFFNFSTSRKTPVNPVIFSSIPGIAKTAYLHESPSLSSCRVAVIDERTGAKHGHIFTGSLPDEGTVVHFITQNSATARETVSASCTTTAGFPSGWSVRFFNESTGSFMPENIPLGLDVPSNGTVHFIAGIGSADYLNSLQGSLGAFTPGISRVYQIPHTGTIAINFTLPVLADNIHQISCIFIDLKGRVALKKSFSGGFSAGENRLIIPTGDNHGPGLRSGVYLFRMSIQGVGRAVFTRKITVMF